MGRAKKPSPGRLTTILVFLAFVVVPPLIGLQFREPPTDRHIHVESFRYGKEPSVIRVNRGDRLHLTFSTRDAGHSFFLEEFDLDAKISPGSPTVEVFRATDPEAGFERRREVVLVADPPGFLGSLYSKFQFRCHVWCGPMHAFEHGTLVVRPNLLLFAALGGLFGILFLAHWRVRAGRDEPPAPPRRGLDLLQRFPWVARLLRRRSFQFAVILPALVLLQIVILTTLFGTQMSGRNLGVMLLWVVWLFFLVAVMTPLGGRIWCMVCPLPWPGEALQRRSIVGVRHLPGGSRYKNRLLGLARRWPAALENAWPRAVVFLALATFSVALVAHPAVTGWVLLGMVVLAAVLSLVFELRAFCRFLCPINAFVGLYGTTGKLALRLRDRPTCDDCGPRSCEKGGVRGWPCPYGLCVAEIDENHDCGLCTECLKTCPYDNIGLYWRPFAEERKVRSAGEAWLAMMMFVVGVAYSAVYLGPWPDLRDLVNILDKGNWDGFALYAAGLWLVSLAVFPALVRLIAAAGKLLSGKKGGSNAVFRRSTAALVPLGLTVWVAFSIPMLLVNRTFVLQSISDPFGRGWNLLGMAGDPWRQVWPQGIPWLQAAVLLLGFGYALRTGYRAWREETGAKEAALRGFAPLCGLLTVLVGGLLWFFTN